MKYVFFAIIGLAGLFAGWLLVAPGTDLPGQKVEAVESSPSPGTVGEAAAPEQAQSRREKEDSFIDGRGALDVERWASLLSDRECGETMQPDVHAVIEVLEQRYEAGEREAAAFIAAAYSCETFLERPAFAHERQRYWTGIAAGQGLAWGYYLQASIAMNRMLGIHGDLAPEEIERARATWQEALLKHYALTGEPDDLQSLAMSYAHTYGPIFDAGRARKWTREWASVATGSERASVGKMLIGRGWGGYRDSLLGAELLVQAGEAGNADAVLDLMEFIAACEGRQPSPGLPHIETLYRKVRSLQGASVRGLMAVAAERSRRGDGGSAYLALSEAQTVQQAENPYDTSTLQMLARLGEHVRSGGVLRLADVNAGACDPQPQMPE